MFSEEEQNLRQLFKTILFTLFECFKCICSISPIFPTLFECFKRICSISPIFPTLFECFNRICSISPIYPWTVLTRVGLQRVSKLPPHHHGTTNTKYHKHKRKILSLEYPIYETSKHIFLRWIQRHPMICLLHLLFDVNHSNWESQPINHLFKLHFQERFELFKIVYFLTPLQSSHLPSLHLKTYSARCWPIISVSRVATWNLILDILVGRVTCLQWVEAPKPYSWISTRNHITCYSCDCWEGSGRGDPRGGSLSMARSTTTTNTTSTKIYQTDKSQILPSFISSRRSLE